MDMLVSVVVPVYNMEKYLVRCVESILSQTYTRLEIFLVDDGSTDSSGSMCDEYSQKDSRIKVIHKQNGGLSSARNAGLEVATGEYINFVDADDWLEPDAYEILVNKVKSPEANYPDILRFNAFRGDQILNRPAFEGLYTGERLRNEVALTAIGQDKLGGLFIMGVIWTDFYKRKFLTDNNLTFTIIKRYEDRLFTVEAFLKADSLYFLNVPLYHYTYIGDSMSNKHDADRWQRELDYMTAMTKVCTAMKVDPKDSAHRMRNEYLLRAMNTVHHEFFSANPNSFSSKYRKVKEIVNNPHVVDAAKDIRKVKHSKKDNLILFFIQYRWAFALSLFESFILIVNKIKNG